jgi:hypothetical protein
MGEEGLKIKAYVGVDHAGTLTKRVLREFQLYVAEVYGIKVDVDVIELPLVEEEGEGVIPLVIVNDRIVSKGEPPSLSRLVDEVFQSIEMELTRTLMGFPVLGESGQSLQAPVNTTYYIITESPPFKARMERFKARLTQP